MITIKKYKFGEEPEVDEDVLAMSDQQKIELMTMLVKTSWHFVNNTKPFTRLDRSIVKIIRPENNKSCIGAYLQ